MAGELDIEALMERVEELARAQVDAERIIASIVVEFQVPKAQVTALFSMPEMVEMVENMAIAGQAELQARMWQVARDLTDFREGVNMAQWLAKKKLGGVPVVLRRNLPIDR